MRKCPYCGEMILGEYEGSGDCPSCGEMPSLDQENDDLYFDDDEG